MFVKISNALADLIAAEAKTQLDGGFLFIFTGPVPASANDALDMVADHTEIVKISVNGDGVTGLTFEAPDNGQLNKETTEDWEGTAAFDGADELEATLAPTFYRFCKAGDTGRGAADETTGHRVQGTVGGPTSGADLVLGVNTIANAAVQPISNFGLTFG